MLTVTINIADIGTPFTTGGKSTAGHMWFSLDNGNGTITSRGFAPDKPHEGQPFAPGDVHKNDNTDYTTRAYTRTIEITQGQYDTLINFGKNPDSPDFNFDMYYNVITNSCIDFVWKALELIGLTDGFEGDLVPSWNANNVSGIYAEILSESNHLLDNLKDTFFSYSGVTTNTLLDIQTETELLPGFHKAVGDSDFATMTFQGLAFDTGVSSAQLLSTMLNGNGFWNTALSDVVTDGVRPGNFNISAENHLWNTLNSNFMTTTNFQSFNTTTSSSLNNLTFGAINSIFVDPLVLDLNGDGVHLTDFGANPVLFDIDNDGGSQELTGWVSAADGILVQDLNGNGKIDNIRETFSEYFNGTAGSNGNAGSKPYRDGFAALKSQDSNGDNKFTVADANWVNVQVWVDANHDGITDSGELKTLAALGITQINLDANTQSGLIKDGNEVLASGSFVQNGLTQEALALNFLADPNGHDFVGSGTGTKITTQGNVSSYVANSTLGETIDVTQKAVNNAYGGAGDDILIGNSGDNWLAGGGGSDTFNAGAGNDVLLIDVADLQANIHAGDGIDIVQVIGDQGVILNLTQAAVEVVRGGRGNDIFISGGGSNTFVRAGDGDDLLVGGAANDALSGENGDDIIDGGAGNDLIRGHRGSDQLLGGAGDDIVQGGQDDDRLNGGAGNDVLNGGQGDDVLDGGAGADLAEYSGSYADYRITQLTATTYRVVDTKSGRDGADTLSNIEKLSFKDISWIAPDLASPLPVKDVLSKDANNLAFNHTAAHLISKAQLLSNDLDRQNDVLHITALSNVQGGTATLTAAGDVLFTPDANYKGIMGFKYSIADASNHSTEITETATGQSATMKAAVYLKTSELPSDPLLTDQWYLSEANIIPVWKDYTGKGVKIGQFEFGGEFAVGAEVLDVTHPDIKPNLDINWLADANHAIPQTYSTHATLVAGVMVAARNGEGGVGVAYDANIAGYWLPNAPTSSSDWDALKYMAQYDVVNNSWGLKPNFIGSFATLPWLESYYINAAASGRNGLGTAIVTAGGNDRTDGGNTNYESVSNNRFVITVGGINAVNDIGALQFGGSPFSNLGATILISAPASNVTSTSRMIESDNGSTFGSDYNNVQGTSFATPIISGVIALMLEANPNLGYRDVQEILAISAKKINDPNTLWQTNHAGNWNGGGMHVSHDYGFGEVDAQAAVRLAETWAKQQTFYTEDSTIPVSSGVVNLAIPNGSISGITSKLTVANAAALKVEHVEVTVNLTHANAGDLIIKLISPGANGTESILMNRPGKTPGSLDTDTGDVGFASVNPNGGDPIISNTLSFTFGTVRDWGESPNGEWTLQIIDAATGNAVGTLNSWNIKLYGNDDFADDQYVYTDEYATMPLGDIARKTLNDMDGGWDTINAAAISGSVSVNLTTGASTLNGAVLTISNPATIENVIGGEYNDTLTGNAGSNLLAAGRGNDTLNGAAGNDLLWGGRGNDTLIGGSGIDGFVIEKEANAVDTINDFLLGTDRIFLSGFGTLTGNTVTKVQEGVNTRLILPDGQSVLILNMQSTALTVNNFVSVKDGIAMRDLAGKSGFGYGTDAADSDNGWASGDGIFWAGDGNERVFAGSGNDKILGGAGNDVLVGENNPSLAVGGNDILLGEEGQDSLYGSGGNDTLKGGSGIDYLAGGYGNDNLYLEGDEGLGAYGGIYISEQIGNTYTGNVTLYNAIMNGARVEGNQGMDTFVVVEDTAATVSEGFLKNIIFDFDPNTTGEKIDLSGVRLVHTFSELNFSTISTVENGTPQQYLRIWLGQAVSGTQYITLKGILQSQLNTDDFIFWNGITPEAQVKNALINGDSLANILIGDAGGNTLDGSVGADDMTGRTGDDTYIVDNIGDTVNELLGGGYDAVQSSVSCSLPDNVEQLTLTGISAINGTGNADANRIVGNSSNNILDGKDGSDDLLGGAGNDTYLVDVGTDRITEQTNEGIDTVQSSVSYLLGNNLENLTLTGLDAINATGNELNNVLVGNAADNNLDGSLGADSMAGGAVTIPILWIM